MIQVKDLYKGVNSGTKVWVTYVGSRIGFRESGEIVTDYLDRESFLCLYKLVKRAKDEVIAEPKYKPQVNNAVSHPKHYTSHPSGIECIEVTRHYNFAIGNAIKYLWRCGLKDGNSSIQELEKAAWYIQDEIKRLKNEKR